jgi:hypothetical protein
MLLLLLLLLLQLFGALLGKVELLGCNHVGIPLTSILACH